jgi:hypothetical protein
LILRNQNISFSPKAWTLNKTQPWGNKLYQNNRSTMDQGISPRPVTAGSWVQSEAGPCEICGIKRVLGRVRPRVLSSSSLSIILSMLHTLPLIYHWRHIQGYS